MFILDKKTQAVAVTPASAAGGSNIWFTHPETGKRVCVVGKWPTIDIDLFQFTLQATPDDKCPTELFKLQSCRAFPMAVTRQTAKHFAQAVLSRAKDRFPNNPDKQCAWIQTTSKALSAALVTAIQPDKKRVNPVHVLERVAYPAKKKDNGGSGELDQKTCQFLLQHHDLIRLWVSYDRPDMADWLPGPTLAKMTPMQRKMWHVLFQTEDKFRLFFEPVPEHKAADDDLIRSRFARTWEEFTESEQVRRGVLDGTVDRLQGKGEPPRLYSNMDKKKDVAWAELTELMDFHGIFLSVSYLWKVHSTKGVLHFLKETCRFSVQQLEALWLADLIRQECASTSSTAVPFDAKTGTLRLESKELPAIHGIYSDLFVEWTGSYRLPGICTEKDQPRILTFLQEQGCLIRVANEYVIPAHLHSRSMAAIQTMDKYNRLTRELWPDASIILNPQHPEALVNDAPPREAVEWDEDQKAALELIRHGDAAFILITGKPGTGKTTLIRQLLGCREMKEMGLQFRGKKKKQQQRETPGTAIQPSGIVLVPTGAILFHVDKIRGPVFTYDYLLTYLHHHPRPWLFRHVRWIVMDEINMCHESLFVMLMQKLLGACPLLPRVMMFGDANQLQSVEKGNLAKFLILAAEQGLVVAKELRQVHRSSVRSGLAPAMDCLLHASSPIELQPYCNKTIASLLSKTASVPLGMHIVAATEQQAIELALKLERQVGKGCVQMQCHSNRMRQQFNEGMRLASGFENGIHGWPTYRGAKVRVIPTQKLLYDCLTKELVKVRHNERFVIDGVSMDGNQIAMTDSLRHFVFRMNDLSRVFEAAEGLTIYAMEGQEAEAVVEVIEFRNNRRLVYTGGSRSREICVLITKPGRDPATEMCRVLTAPEESRESALFLTLQQLHLSLLPPPLERVQ